MITASTTTVVRCSDGFTHTVESSVATTARRRIKAVCSGTSVPSSGSRLLHIVGNTSVTQHDAVVLPLELLEGVLAGYRSDRCNLRLCSDSYVYRWWPAPATTPAAPAVRRADIYVKAQRLANMRDPPVSREAAVMRWLHSTHPTVATEVLPVPKVLAEVTEGGADFVATEALGGASSHTLVTRGSSRNAVVAAVRSNATALRQLHDSVDTAGCPFQCGIASEIAAARERLRAQVLPLDEWYASIMLLPTWNRLHLFCAVSHASLQASALLLADSSLAATFVRMRLVANAGSFRTRLRKNCTSWRS